MLDGPGHEVRELVFMKACGLGITEFLIVRTMRHLAQGWAELYVLPTSVIRDDFSAERIDKLIRQSPHYQHGVACHLGSSERLRQKHLWSGVLQLGNAESRNTFKSFPADEVIIDEVDECDPDNIKLAPDRLSASGHKYLTLVGNPTVKGTGIHAAYERSSQGEWNVRCAACREWQPIDWFENVVRQTDNGSWEPRGRLTSHSKSGVTSVCKNCEAPLDRLGPGEWVHAFPDKDVRGFQLSKLVAPNIFLDRLFAKWLEVQGDDTELQIFYNSDLGLPYMGEGSSITPEILRAAAGDFGIELAAPRHGDKMAATVAGIDIGTPNYVTVYEMRKGEEADRRLIFAGPSSWDGLKDIVERYSVKLAVLDSEPEKEKAREFRDSFRSGRIWLADYIKQSPGVFWTLDEKEHVVKSGRTPTLDRSLRDVVTKRVIFPRNVLSLDGGNFKKQAGAPTRRFLLKPRPKFVWDEGKQADHYCHALGYGMLAAMLYRKFSGDYVTVI